MMDEPDGFGDDRDDGGAGNLHGRSERGACTLPDYAYMSRWIPNPPRPTTRWDFYMACFGTFLLGCAIIAAVVRRVWF